MNEPMMDRVPPHNREAEQSVIGAIFLDPQSLITASEILLADDFYHNAHKQIFETMLRLSDQGKAIDVVTVTKNYQLKKKLRLLAGYRIYLSSPMLSLRQQT